LQEGVGVGSNKLSQLGVTGAKLLKNWLEHLGLLLNDLAELLELRVRAQKVQISKVSTSCSRGGRGSSSSVGCIASASCGPSTSVLSSKVKQIYISALVVTTSLTSLASSCLGSFGRLRRRSRSGSLALLLLLLDVLRNTL
jgi:hypothetical protein